MSDEFGRNDEDDGADISNIDSGKIKEKLLSLWNGDVPLFQTFWIYYFIGVFIIKLAGIVFGLEGFFGFAALLWAGFMVKPIMVSADKYAGERLWQIAAKVAAVLIVIGVLSDLFL